ncbi:hypothetical protein EV175_005709 [Coemansia sp. RSA 1933]|nr:hypothetical protein EV175_005709 [Coemansia sp. RSA 1933]
MRVDVPPAINTSIHTLDALFSQHHRSNGGVYDKGCESDTDASCKSGSTSEPQSAGSEPTLVPVHEDNDIPTDQGSLVRLEKGQDDDGKTGRIFEQVLDTLFPHPGPESSLLHVYFNVATVDGEPNIPDYYDCTIAMCTARYRRFEGLQNHWATHPWNRRSILLPVTAGGLRRLGFWQHKARFFRSLVQGPYCVDRAESDRKDAAPASTHISIVQRMFGKRDRAGYQADLNAGSVALTSDCGDIRLLGPSSYFVSPRVLSAEQVRMWEDARDKRAQKQSLVLI